MKKRFRRIIAVLLAVLMVALMIPFGIISVSAANTADSLVAVAEGELGNTNYSKYYGGNKGAWCADFVTWCAQQAGVTSIAYSSSCYYMYNGMIANGCQEVSSPQRGDIVFFFCNSCSGTANIWCHVGIMVNSTTSIDGNYGGKVSYDNSYSHYGSLGYKHSGGISKIYVRPNYDNISNNFPGEEDTSWNVPVWKTANSQLNTYNDYGTQESGRWIDAGDNCYIEKVYQNGYVHVMYPTPSGDRWAYAYASGFSLDKKLPIPSGSQTISDGEYHIVSVLDANKGIDVYTGSTENGANVDLYPNLDDVNQVFDITYLGDGSYKIINQHSGRSLDCEGAGITAGTNLQQWDYCNEPQQQWIIEETGDGESFYITSQKSGLRIDVDNASTEDFTNLKLYTPYETNAQKWKFVAWGKNVGETISEGEYHIASRINSDMCLDVYSASKDNSANIDLYTNITDSEQVFVISYLGDGYYKIINKNSGKSLDLQGGKCVSGTNVQQYQYEDVNQQKWIIKPTADGQAFNIISKKGGLYIDVQSGVANDLQNIHGYINNGTTAQQWRFIAWQGDNAPQTLSNGEYRIATAINETRALDVVGASSDDGANIGIYSNLNDPKQTFNLKYLDNGFYSITNSFSNKVLDVAGDRVINNTNVIQYYSNGGVNQEWLLKESGDGYHYIISHSNGMALDLLDAKDEDGANVAIHIQNQTSAQKWKLRRVLKPNMVEINDVVLKNGEIRPIITVSVDNNVLVESTDYTVSTYNENNKLYVKIIGIGDYCDCVSIEIQRPTEICITDGVYYENGVAKNPGLVKVGNDIYCTTREGKLVYGDKEIFSSRTNGLLPPGVYHFDEVTGKLYKDNVIIDGIYYKGGKVSNAGIVKVAGSYYVTTTKGVIVKNVENKYIASSRTNGLVAVGYYDFGEDGKMILKNGIVGGKYYINGKASNVGLFAYEINSVNNIYCTTTDGVILKNVTDKYIYSSRTNGLVKPGYYSFDSDGKMITG